MIDISKHPSGTIVNISLNRNLIIVWKKDVANGTFPPFRNNISIDMISDKDEVFMLGERDDGAYSPYWLFNAHITCNVVENPPRNFEVGDIVCGPKVMQGSGPRPLHWTDADGMMGTIIDVSSNKSNELEVKFHLRNSKLFVDQKYMTIVKKMSASVTCSVETSCSHHNTATVPCGIGPTAQMITVCRDCKQEISGETYASV